MRARADRAFQALDIPTPENDVQFLSATESSLYLLEILARIELPPSNEIPASGPLGVDSPSSWAVPHTELVLERFDSENGQPLGYRFSAETIERLPEFHQRVRGLPVKAPLARLDGVVERFQLRPSLTAPGWLQAMVQKLPAPWFRSVAGEPLWKWFALIATALAVLLAYIAVFRMTVRVEANPTLATDSGPDFTTDSRASVAAAERATAATDRRLGRRRGGEGVARLMRRRLSQGSPLLRIDEVFESHAVEE